MNRTYYRCTSNYTFEIFSQINNLFEKNPSLNSEEILNTSIDNNRYSRNKIIDFLFPNLPWNLKSSYFSFEERKIPFFIFNDNYCGSFLHKIRVQENDCVSFSNYFSDLNDLFFLNKEAYSQQNSLKCFSFKQNKENQIYNIVSFDNNLKQISSYKEIPVFSVFSKDIYNAVDIANLDYFDETVISNTILNTCILPNSFCRILENKEINFNSLNLFNFNFDFDLTNYLNSIESNHLQVLKVPSWLAISKDTKIEFTYYTKNQALKRNTCFIPVLFKIKYFDSFCEEKDCYIFSFISNASMDNINKKNPKKRFKDLLDIIFDENGLKLISLEEYEKRLAIKFKSLAKFSSTHLEKIDNDSIQELLKISTPEYDLFSQKLNSSILSKPEIDFNLEQKFNKFQLLIETNKSKIQSIELANSLFDLKKKKNLFLNLSKEINEVLKEIEKRKEDFLINFKELTNSCNYLISNHSLYNEIKLKYDLAINSSCEKENFETNDFLNNLTKQNIYINYIKYKTENNTTFYLTNKTFNNISNKEKNEFYIKSFKGLYKIEEVEFLLNAPVEIKIIEKNQSVFGGPYIIQASPRNLKIKLASNNSLFGYNFDNKNYYIHPHAQSRTNIQDLFAWTNTCLGEASPLIWHAFEKNDLKLIILSCLTWIKSANSADPWGSNYIHFSKDLNPLNSKFEEENVTDIEVNDFLASFNEEEDFNKEEDLQIVDLAEENQTNTLTAAPAFVNYIPFITRNTTYES